MINPQQEVTLFLSKMQVPVTTGFIARNLSMYHYRVRAILNDMAKQNLVQVFDYGERQLYKLVQCS